MIIICAHFCLIFNQQLNLTFALLFYSLFRSSARKTSTSLEARQAQIAAANQAATSIAKMPQQLPPPKVPKPTMAGLRMSSGMIPMLAPSSTAPALSNLFSLGPGSAAAAAASIDERRSVLLAREQIMHERRMNAILDSTAAAISATGSLPTSALASRQAVLMDEGFPSTDFTQARSLRRAMLESDLYNMTNTSALRGLGGIDSSFANSRLTSNRLSIAPASFPDDSILYREMLSSMSGMGCLDRPGQSDAALVDMLIRRSDSARAASMASGAGSFWNSRSNSSAQKKLTADLLKFAGGVTRK